MEPAEAAALAELRTFNYERIYVRPASREQSRAVIEVLHALVEHYAAHPAAMPAPPDDDAGTETAVRAAVTYVAGMTDRYAFSSAVAELGWDPERLPQGIDHGE
jgi:dGTPase